MVETQDAPGIAWQDDTDWSSPLTIGRDESCFGRYELIRGLGEGGMGVVHLARDPGLDRLVALKRLHARFDDDARSAAFQSRLRREARAMARLDHDNVVRVHEVGEQDGCTFLAMEYVDGITLTHWLAQDSRRRWEDIVEVFIAAGEGLMAVHEVGLTHCDFKPDNVLMGDNGAIKVSDFGLVHSHENNPTESTRAGRFVTVSSMERTAGMSRPCGTPAFMAPEQFMGLRADHRGDQFSFCVALFSALYRTPPFEGETPRELFINVLEGLITPPAKQHKVPVALRQAIERGMMVDPEDRWPSMTELLAELRRVLGARARRRRRVLVGAILLPVLLLGVAEGLSRHERSRAVAACEEQGKAIDEIWNDEIRAGVEQRLATSGTEYERTAFDKAIPWLDYYAEDWADRRTQACMNESVHGTFDHELMQRARWCLDTRSKQLEALVQGLVTQQDKIRHAVVAATELPPVDPCVDPEVLEAIPAPPVEDRGAILEVYEILSHANVSSQGERSYLEALQTLEGALARAEQLGWAPLVARARLSYANLLRWDGAYERAARETATAYSEAARAHAWEIASDAAADAIIVVGDELAQFEEARVWSRSAEAVDIFAGDPLGLRRATRLGRLAVVETSAGRYDDALALHEEANLILATELGHEHPKLATGLNNIAATHEALGNYAEAAELYERTLAIRKVQFGPEHTTVASVLNNLAVVRLRVGQTDEAERLFERSLAISRVAMGPHHIDVAVSQSNLATVYFETGKFEDSARMYDEATPVLIETMGADHPNAAKLYSNRALVFSAMGELDKALEGFERALAIFEKTLEPDHATIPTTLGNLAKVHIRRQDLARAREYYERMQDVVERTRGADHVLVSEPLLGLSEVERLQGRFPEAIALAQRATELRDHAEQSAERRAIARFAWAKALWELSPEQAVAMARHCAELLGDMKTKTLDRSHIERWIEDKQAALAASKKRR